MAVTDVNDITNYNVRIVGCIDTKPSDEPSNCAASQTFKWQQECAFVSPIDLPADNEPSTII